MSQEKLDIILERYPDEEFLTPDGLVDALLGVDDHSMRLVYSKSKIIQILIEQEEMSEEDALEHYYYNIHGAYVGERTPIYVEDDFE